MATEPVLLAAPMTTLTADATASGDARGRG
jgi:hypothetical protein